MSGRATSFVSYRLRSRRARRVRGHVSLVVLIAILGGLALASVVAVLPGRSAARTSTALVLRAE